jgi:hypothetical protein
VEAKINRAYFSCRPIGHNDADQHGSLEDGGSLILDLSELNQKWGLQLYFYFLLKNFSSSFLIHSCNVSYLVRIVENSEENGKQLNWSGECEILLFAPIFPCSRSYLFFNVQYSITICHLSIRISNHFSAKKFRTLCERQSSFHAFRMFIKPCIILLITIQFGAILADESGEDRRGGPIEGKPLEDAKVFDDPYLAAEKGKRGLDLRYISLLL